MQQLLSYRRRGRQETPGAATPHIPAYQRTQRVFAALGMLLLVAADWPQFRGAWTGVAPDANPPIQWSEPDSRQIAWKVPVPGRGPSSPIVVGDRVFVTSSEGSSQERMLVLCFDAKTGQQRWRRTFWATGRTASHPDSSNAAPTPASDGERVFAFFSSNDLIALSLDGELLWYRGLAFDYPKAGNDVGMASSPVVVEGTVIVQVENQGDSFAAGIDARTGETRWRIEREPIANWTSPAVWARSDGTATVLLQSARGLTAHDPSTGQLRWQYSVSCDLIPSPTLREDRALFVAADRLMMLKLAASDNEPAPTPMWDAARLRPGAASPVLAGERVYTVNRVGVLACARADTGSVVWQLRLPGEFWATPVVAGERMYLVSRAGDVVVVRLGADEGEILATNPLGETILASPAIAGDALYVRGSNSLWKIGAES